MKNNKKTGFRVPHQISATVLLGLLLMFSSVAAIAVDKALYLETGTGQTLTRIAATVSNTTTIAGAGASSSWTLPALTKDITLTTATTIPITIVRHETGPQAFRDMAITLSSSVSGVFATYSAWEAPTGTPTANIYSLTTAGSVTISAGETITLTITNNTAQANRNYVVTDVGSQVDLPTETYINVDSVVFYDSPPTVVIASASAGDTVTVQSTISDPFGSADINPSGDGTGIAGDPAIVLSGVSATPASGNMVMVSEDTANGTRTYQFTTTVNSAGTLQADITATEGYETGTAEVTNTGIGTLSVPGAAMTLTKYVSTNATCSDTLTTLSDVVVGTDVYYCYTVTNAGTETFTIGGSGITDDRGIDISSLEGTYTAGTTNTHNAGPFTTGTDPEVPLGTTVNVVNASATWASGTLNESTQASLTVISAAPATGIKPLYLDNNTLVRVAPGAALNVQVDGLGSSASWPLAALVRDATIENTGSIDVTLVRSETGPGAFRNITLELSANNGVGTIASWSGWETTPGTATAQTYSLVIDAGWGSSNINVPSGSIITLSVINNSGAANNRYFVTELGSQVDLPVLTAINIEEVIFFDSPPVTQITGVTVGATITVQATISDPFGSADINPPAGPAGLPSITLSGVTATPASGTMTMTSEDTANGIRTYQFTTTVSSTGVLQADVLATEGEDQVMTHTLPGYLPVSSANLTMLKQANKSSAKPGELVIYTLTVVNTGVGQATSVEVEDKLSEFAAFGLDTFGASQPFNFNLTNTSGSSTLTLGSTDYATTGPVWGKTLSDGAGGAPAGYDGLVSNWKVTFTGNLQAGDQFTLQYGATAK